MEGIHGVDTSWLHHSRGQRAAYTYQQQQQHQQSTPSGKPLLASALNDDRPSSATSEASTLNDVNGHADQPNGSAQHHEHHNHLSRPHLPARKSSEKARNEPDTTPPRSGSNKAPPSPGLTRKSSWMSSLTSKFSGSSPAPQHNQNNAASPGKNQPHSPAQGSSANGAPRNETAPMSTSPKAAGSSFLSSALRRFSSSGGAAPSKVVPNGGLCPRRVMNVDHHRERCQIPDLQPAKLRRVAFSVDVEIAAPPKYKEEEPAEPAVAPASGLPYIGGRRRAGSAPEHDKKSKVKNKERSEGEALKHPNVMAEKKEKSKQLSGKDESNGVAAIDEAPPRTENPGKPAVAVPRNNTNGSPVPLARVTSPPIHPNFGPNSMFEVDEWDDVPAPPAKRPARRGSTGGAEHHDFGRHGMFEIPSSSEDEAMEAKKSASRSRGLSDASAKTPRKIAQAIDREDREVREKISKEDHNLPSADQESTKESQSAETPQATTDDADGTLGEAGRDEQPVKETTRKKEKKKRSEEERKERKEKKRQAAIANGTLPVELNESESTTVKSNKPSRPQSRPTTDPLRIYKRCCQLRETNPLPRVVEQLSAPNACDPLNLAVVLSLDLSNQTLQLQDVVTLGDWLAVVPVQKLMLENCGLTDEAVRVVLAGLLAAKTSEQAKHNKQLMKKQIKDKKERLGVISKLSLKNNKMIGKHGWIHIGLFLNMSRSLKAIDLSMVPFPRPPPMPAKTNSAGEESGGSRASSLDVAPADPMDIFWKCMAERVAGEQLEEVVMSDCSLTADHVEKLVDAVIACRVSRLGIAHSSLDTKGFHAIARYLNDRSCMGLDLGGNKFSQQEDLNTILNAIDYADNQMYAVSLADCDLTPADLKSILPVLARLPAFRFVDLSHNPKLFESSPNALSVLSKWLPRMKTLKRLGLNDVAMQSEHAIALAEICPEMPMLAHLSLSGNPALAALAGAQDEAAQEEACALYASLMAATRVSSTIVCIDIDVPTKENSEVVKALAKQVVAYSLRNMERSEHYKAAAAIIAEPHGGEDAVAVPDVLLHLVGHVDKLGGDDDDDDDEPTAPDQDYLVGGTGVVKALSVVLGQKARDARRMSREVTPVTSGTNTPRLSEDAKGKARDMSRNLLDSARKIRHRLQPALVRAKADAPEEENSKRLGYLDATLERMIQRFEDEYPECRPVGRPRSNTAASNLTATTPGALSGSFNDPFGPGHEAISAPADADEGAGVLGSLTRSSRHGSDVSLASRHLSQEEGQMHRFGQRMRRELIPPTYTVDHHWGTTGAGEEPTHIEQLRVQLENMSGQELKTEVEKKGLERVIDEMKVTAAGLKELQHADPETWRKCRDAGMCVKMNGDDVPIIAEAKDFEDNSAVQAEKGHNMEMRDGLTTAG